MVDSPMSPSVQEGKQVVVSTLPVCWATAFSVIVPIMTKSRLVQPLDLTATDRRLNEPSLPSY